MSPPALAEAYGAAALLGGVSRLLIDLNRGPGDPTLVMKLSDGSIIPGNRGADDGGSGATARSNSMRPIMPRSVNEIGAHRRSEPILISIHSFTPSWKSVARPWEVGVLYGRDARLAVPLMRQLAAAGFTVGDNEPYTGALEGDTLEPMAPRPAMPMC